MFVQSVVMNNDEIGEGPVLYEKTNIWLLKSQRSEKANTNFKRIIQ